MAWLRFRLLCAGEVQGEEAQAGLRPNSRLGSHIEDDQLVQQCVALAANQVLVGLSSALEKFVQCSPMFVR